MPYKHRKFPQNKMVYLDDRTMWLRVAAAVGLLALGATMLTGCGDEDNIAPAGGPTDPNAGAGTAMEGQNLSLDPSGTYMPADPSMTMLLPTSSSQYPVVSGTENGKPAIPVAYRGGWANDVQDCALPDGQWRFEEMGTSTGKGVKCSLDALQNPAGSPSTTLILSCTGEGMTSPEQWELSNPEEGRMNLIRKFDDANGGGIDGGGTLKLIHCPTMAERDPYDLHMIDRS